jgi:hypothetical protein
MMAAILGRLKALLFNNSFMEGYPKTTGRILVGGLVESVNFPRGKKTPIIDVEGCNEIIIVSSNYFLQNKGLIEAWAQKKILR